MTIDPANQHPFSFIIQCTRPGPGRNGTCETQEGVDFALPAGAQRLAIDYVSA